MSDETPPTASEVVRDIDERLADLDRMLMRRVARHVVSACEAIGLGNLFHAGMLWHAARCECSGFVTDDARQKADELIRALRVAGVEAELDVAPTVLVSALLERAREAAR